jgi:hypothetical protein
MALPGFAVSSVVALGATSASSRVAVSGTTALVTNLGPSPVFLLLGSSSVVATVASGTALLPGASLPLTIGANTYLAAITQSGNASLNIGLGA